MSKDKYLNALSVSDFFAQSHVNRYHTERVTREQYLAEHSHRVAFIAVKILYDFADWVRDNKHHYTSGEAYSLEPDIDFVELGIHRYASIHDVVESENSDVPSHIKAYLREDHGIDLNPIMHRMFWKKRGFNGDDYEYSTVVKALVSLADTIEGKTFAVFHVPSGEVQQGVILDWDSAFRKKLDKFEPIFGKEFLYNVVFTKYYRANMSIDPAWA